MNRQMIKGNKKGFTLVEIIVVLIIIAILVAIAIPAFTQYIDKSRIGVMEHNQGQVIRTIQLLGIEGALSQTWDEDDMLDPNELFRDELVKAGFFVANPINKSTAIKTTDQIGRVNTTFAGIVISHRKDIASLNYSGKAKLYPYSDTSKNSIPKIQGAVIVVVVPEGAITYYYYEGEHYNIRKIPIDY